MIGRRGAGRPDKRIIGRPAAAGGNIVTSATDMVYGLEDRRRP